eukprot:CAMPEP_0184729908 /NCGR_PEP_ID=MMETSP0314-20130426/45866_1 /TAXON_ID=38298 /ORGANISM="Rhodella maculata, Strain CCMP 736" /LENGTH=37 /DNA_ID= /DNA_START= /DNA_END= /DNA_ORIENTATION=
MTDAGEHRTGGHADEDGDAVVVVNDRGELLNDGPIES